jgi:hypothetical protein
MTCINTHPPTGQFPFLSSLESSDTTLMGWASGLQTTATTSSRRLNLHSRDWQWMRDGLRGRTRMKMGASFHGTEIEYEVIDGPSFFFQILDALSFFRDCHWMTVMNDRPSLR